jgi:hypothetical protein
MKYTRKDNQTNKLLFLFVIAVGIGLIYLGFYKFYWTWNLLTFPIGLITIISGYKNYKRTGYTVQEIEFKDDKLRVKFLNGTEKTIENKNLSYSLLVNKFYKPIRSIELIEKKKIGLFRGKSIGIIYVAKWENDIESIAKHLIRNEFERETWRFGWNFGDFLIVFSILLGITEGVAEDYINGLKSNLSQPISDLGVIISDEKNKSKNKSLKLEDKYLKKNKD